MASDTDGETLVFRKFDELSAANLLYLQSEMFDSEAELKRMNQEATEDHSIEVLEATRRWESLVVQCEDPDSRADAMKRMVFILKLGLKIKEYHEWPLLLSSWKLTVCSEDKVLLLQSKVVQLQPPSSRVLDALGQMFW
ncbi:hypothetical protein HD806DRAFT_501539 [Xylariaceae sp. AK1471]|nr:hypothetical protein HD806DRAFT_501539 [Xylariaceae sp. AK1471]